MAYYKHCIHRLVKYTYGCIFRLVANPLKHLCCFSVLSLNVRSDAEEYKYKYKSYILA